jgi:hypothetical protein
MILSFPISLSLSLSLFFFLSIFPPPTFSLYDIFMSFAVCFFSLFHLDIFFYAVRIFSLFLCCLKFVTLLHNYIYNFAIICHYLYAHVLS